MTGRRCRVESEPLVKLVVAAGEAGERLPVEAFDSQAHPRGDSLPFTRTRSGRSQPRRRLRLVERLHELIEVVLRHGGDPRC